MYYFTSSIIYGSTEWKYYELGLAGGIWLISGAGMCLYWFLEKNTSNIELNTPTHCCTGISKMCCHTTLTIISASTVAFFLACLNVIIPKVTFVYYLYPTRTLARLPFLITAFIYINSTIALLIFYIENAVYIAIRNIDREESKYHMSHYDLTLRLVVILAPCPIFFVLMYVVLVVIVIGGLAFTHSNNFKDNQLETLIALLPSLFLLLGSLHKRDLFFMDRKEENQAPSPGSERSGSMRTGSGRPGSRETGSETPGSTKTGRGTVALEMPDEDTSLLHSTIN